MSAERGSYLQPRTSLLYNEKEEEDDNEEEEEEESTLSKNETLAVIFTIFFSLFIVLCVATWLAFIVVNIKFYHEYPRLPTSIDGGTFVSSRYNAQWFFVYLALFNVIPPLILLLALVDKRNIIMLYFYQLVCSVVVVLGVILLACLLGIWLLNCNGSTSFKSICADERWCCAFWQTSGGSLCPNTGECLLSSGILGVFSWDDLHANPIFKWHCICVLALAVFNTLELSVFVRMLKKFNYWKDSFSSFSLKDEENGDYEEEELFNVGLKSRPTFKRLKHKKTRARKSRKSY